ncbi:YqgE/AlgH family protein [Vibrio sp.]|nr:YqgE/AlgH family protein [Vibrio sp.]
MDLSNHFLVAMPGMNDPYFQHSVVYLCEHNNDGAMGIIINAPIDLTIGSMLEQAQVDPAYPKSKLKSLERLVISGGPISEDRGFILHKPHDTYDSSIQMTEQISITTSKDILSVLGTNAEPDSYLVALGYAGWEAGQLETELTDNSWLTIAADANIMFNTPIPERWNKAVESLGINPCQLSAQSGHA